MEEILAQDSAKDEKQAAMTAGERLAAQQAAKAARKAAQKGRDAELVEEKALAQAAVAKDWLQDNLKPLGLMAGGVILVAAIGIGWSTYTRGQETEAGSALAAEGTPFLEIIRYAREHEIDLIVMGTHGRSGLGHVLIGSVAERVVRKSPCPVLTIRPGGHEFVMP